MYVHIYEMVVPPCVSEYHHSLPVLIYNICCYVHSCMEVQLCSTSPSSVHVRPIARFTRGGGGVDDDGEGGSLAHRTKV